MVREFIIKEIREQILSFKSLITFVVILILFIVNGFISGMNYRERLAEYEKVRGETNNSLNEGSAVFSNLVYVQQKHIKPPSKLSFISYAEERNLPNAVLLDGFRMQVPGYIKKQNPLFFTLATIDWTNILLIFMSFICIAFAYNSFSGEKVNGTLRLVLANRVYRWQVITGKWAGILAVVLIPLVLGLIINLLIITFTGIELAGRDFLPVAYFLLITVFFLSFNILLGFLVSSLTSRPVVSLSISLAVWIILNVAIPGICWVLAKELRPVESLARIQAGHDEQRAGLWSSDMYYGGWRGEWQGQPPNELVLKRAALMDALDGLHAVTWMDYVNDIFAQTSTGINVSRISPYSLFRFSGEIISDNGFHGFVRFFGQARIYHDIYHEFLLDKDRADPDSYHLVVNEAWSFNSFMSLKPVNYQEIPIFRYAPPGMREILRNTLFNVTILVLWNVFLFAGSFIAFVKYDVR